MTHASRGSSRHTAYPATDRPIAQTRWGRFKKHGLRPLICSMALLLAGLLFWHLWQRPLPHKHTVQSIGFHRNKVYLSFNTEAVMDSLQWHTVLLGDSAWRMTLWPSHIHSPLLREYRDLDLVGLRLVSVGEDSLHLTLDFSRLVDTPQVTLDSAHHRLTVHFNRDLDSMHVVILDPGHGGHNAGAIGEHGLLEKNVNLDIVKRIEKKLRKQRGIRVVLTRHDDRFISLSRRRNLSNQWGADLFLSIHGNSAKDRRIDMPEVYYLGRRHTSTALRLLHAMKAVVPADTGIIRQRGFAVLRGNWARHGAYLLETLYLSHPRGERLLSQADMRETLAQALSETAVEILKTSDNDF